MWIPTELENAKQEKWRDLSTKTTSKANTNRISQKLTPKITLTELKKQSQKIGEIN